MTITLLNDEKALAKLIKLAGTQGAKFAETVHNAAYNCLAACDRTGDIRPMQSLYDVLPRRGQIALAVYATTFGKFRFVNAKVGEDGKMQAAKFAFASKAVTNLADAEKIGPMEYVKDKKPATKHAFDLRAELDKLLKRAAKNHVVGPAIGLMEQAKAKA